MLDNVLNHQKEIRLECLLRVEPRRAHRQDAVKRMPKADSHADHDMTQAPDISTLRLGFDMWWKKMEILLLHVRRIFFFAAFNITQTGQRKPSLTLYNRRDLARC